MPDRRALLGRLSARLKLDGTESAGLREELDGTRRALAEERERSKQWKADARGWRKEAGRWKKDARRWKKDASRLQGSLLSEATNAEPSSRPAPAHQDASAYLDLMKRTVSGWVYADVNILDEQKSGLELHADNADSADWRSFDPALREQGADWPKNAQTMIGLRRLDNLQSCVEDVLANDVPGDLIEAGVWRGGATIFMRAILRAYGVERRRVWVADSFEGLPPPDPDRYPDDSGSPLHTYEELAVSLEEVRASFERYGLLDENVRFLKGWFRDTLPGAPIDRLAVARLDGDMYESTMDALVHLYPKLSVGGYLIVDDYGALRMCRQAVHDYRDAHGIEDEIRWADWSGVFWQRSR